MNGDRSECRSCHAPIRWAETEHGKPIPVDPEPVENGNLAMTDLRVGGPLLVRYLGKGEIPPAEVPRYVAHFATCPHGAEWRKKKPNNKEASSGAR